MMDLVTAGWFHGSSLVRIHSDGTLEVRAGGIAYRAAPSEWLAGVPAKPDTRRLPHERKVPGQSEPGEAG